MGVGNQQTAMPNQIAAAVAAPKTRKQIDFIGLVERMEEAYMEMYDMNRGNDVFNSYTKKQLEAAEQLVEKCAYVTNAFYDTKEEEVRIYD